jgi:hypothetical protein
LFREFSAARQRLADQADRDIRLAWMTAALSRAKKLPPLPSLLSTRHRTQTPAEQLLVMRKISAVLGIPLKERPRHG